MSTVEQLAAGRESRALDAWAAVVLMVGACANSSVPQLASAVDAGRGGTTSGLGGTATGLAGSAVECAGALDARDGARSECDAGAGGASGAMAGNGGGAVAGGGSPEGGRGDAAGSSSEEGGLVDAGGAPPHDGGAGDGRPTGDTDAGGRSGPSDGATGGDHPCPADPLGCWRPMQSPPAALEGRACSSAVWTGTEALVWGGNSASVRALRSGARYDPIHDRWTPMSGFDDAALIARGCAFSLWIDGSFGMGRMLIWGGHNEDNDVEQQRQLVMYDPATDRWDLRGAAGAPHGAWGGSIVWTGKQIVVWSGGYKGFSLRPATGGTYDPSSGQWSAVSATNAPGARHDAITAWTGERMLVWGGRGVNNAPSTGGAYDPQTDLWSSLPQDGAPTTADGYGAWTGTELLAWSGKGGRYDPRTDAWRPMASDGGPSARSGGASVWTGRDLIIWSGDDSATGQVVADGARYDLAQDRWLPLPQEGAPSARAWAAVVWTGRGMLVWGGGTTDTQPTDGAIYYPPPAR